MIAESFANDASLAAYLGPMMRSLLRKTYLSQYKNLMHGYVTRTQKAATSGQVRSGAQGCSCLSIGGASR